MSEQHRKLNPYGSLIPFSWPVAAGGYQWVSGPPEADQHVQLEGGAGMHHTPDKGTGRWLVRKRSARSDLVTKPLVDEPALFRNFANLTCTEESFLAFANQHGTLGPLANDWGGGFIAVDGETEGAEQFAFWKDHMTSMTHAIRLWDALKPEAGEEGIRQLDEWLRLQAWQDDDGEVEPERIVYLPGEYTEWGSVRVFGPDRRSFNSSKHRWPKSPAQAGIVVLSNLVNVGLQNTRARVWETTKVRTLGVPLVIGTEAYNLIGALWLQLALAIEGNLRYKPCERCGRWFHVPPKAKAGSKFCSDSCRVLVYRERKAEVLRLASEGLKPKEIAARTSADLDSIKRWSREAVPVTKPTRKRTKPRAQVRPNKRAHPRSRRG